MQGDNLLLIDPKDNRCVEINFLAVAGAGANRVLGPLPARALGTISDSAAGHRVGLPSNGIGLVPLGNRHDPMQASA